MSVNEGTVSSRVTARIYRLGFNPYVMKAFAKVFYPVFTRLVAGDGQFLNDGYEEDPPMALPLAESDEPNRFPIQLYHRTATQADVSGKRVLEVGSGHGGGASYLTRTLQPASYTALDLNPAAIASCRKRHDVPGLDFVQGNAEDLPFAVESFDAVVNVESSHCYPHFSRFLAEVARVLRPGGHFLYTDLRPRLGIADWEAALASAPLRMVSERVINAEVLRALDERSEGSLESLSRQLPGPLQGIGREAYHVKGSRFYRDLESGEFSWRMYCLIKD
jgi:ubiquinone/menaquinone biosynthesis C-methylase UbiE